MNTKKWKTKDGVKIRIKDMGNDHLLNTIKMIERSVSEIKKEYPYPNFNGEMAQWYAEEEYDRVQNSEPGYFIPIYDDLIEEAERRGLDYES